MSASGACSILLKMPMHRGGADRSNTPQLAFTNQYCEPWARTQKSFFLFRPSWKIRQPEAGPTTATAPHGKP